MALSNDQITAQNFKDFYGQIRPYLNGSAHAGFTPIGTVISVMGNHAPTNYLVCDGTLYNIADYLELASYFLQEFGSSNYFGGDGVDTFAVPDLRGEFLRGSGTNVHENQGNGANVGEHQDATEHSNTFGNSAGDSILTQRVDSTVSIYRNPDSDVVRYPADNKNRAYVTGSGVVTVTSDNQKMYMSRPTNTSVLYCIAYKNIFTDIISDDEIVITKDNVNPSSYYGLAYELFDKDLACRSGSVTFTKTNNVSSVTAAAGELCGNIYHLVFSLTMAVTIGDENVELGTLDLSAFTTKQLRTQNVPAISDAGNGMAGVHFQDQSANPGIITLNTFDAYYTKPIASGKEILFNIDVPIPFNARKDSACNKFYWRRANS